MAKNVTGKATVLDEPKDFLGAAIALGGTAGAIELQERLGAGDVRHTDRFPIERRGITDDQLTAIGFALGAKIDDLFQSVQLPPGWKKDATGHDLWTYVVDAKGRKRFSIFYKAAFYDRSAFANGERRFRVCRDYDTEKKTKKNTVIVMDGDIELHRIVGELKENKYEYGDEAGRQQWLTWSREGDTLEAQARAWLTAKYPKWEDWTAHWND